MSGISGVGSTPVGGPEEAGHAAPAASAAATPSAVTLTSTSLKSDATLQGVASGAAIIEKGARGNAVKLVQQALQKVGITVPGGADGIFGSGTANAIAAFQRQKGLQPSGSLDAATLGALDQALAATGTPGGTPGASTLNERFATDPVLRKVMNGQTSIGSGARGEHVKIVQQALVDMGYNMPVYGADGGYGNEAATAVKRFQRDMGLPQSGKVDKATLAKLASLAPPPGKTLERNPEYDKLFEDGRLDMTIAQGFDENGTMDGSIYRLQSGLKSQGFRKIDPEVMSAADRTRLGVGPDRYEKGATYYTKQITDPRTQKPVDVVVKLITPNSAATPEEVRDMFKRSLERDEVVSYNGHARYGTGPDFDVIDSGRGNFVMDRTGGPTGHPHEPLTTALSDKPDSMLPDLKPFPGKYQLLYFNACTTDNYMVHLRDPNTFKGRNTGNTDIIGTTIPSRLATGADNVLSLVSTLSGRKSVNDFTAEVNKRESDIIQSFIDGGSTTADLDGVDAKKASGLIFESGFADNAGNGVR